MIGRGQRQVVAPVRRTVIEREIQRVDEFAGIVDHVLDGEGDVSTELPGQEFPRQRPGPQVEDLARGAGDGLAHGVKRGGRVGVGAAFAALGDADAINMGRPDEAAFIRGPQAIAALVSAGCEVVRCAVPKIEDADALARIFDAYRGRVAEARRLVE